MALHDFDPPPAHVRQSDSLVELAREANTALHEGIRASQTGIDRYRQCGEALLRAKKKVDPNSWTDWVAKHIQCSLRQAQKYMRLATEWERLKQGDTLAPPGALLSLNDALKMLVEEPPAETTQAKPADPLKCPDCQRKGQMRDCPKCAKLRQTAEAAAKKAAEDKRKADEAAEQDNSEEHGEETTEQAEESPPEVKDEEGHYAPPEVAAVFMETAPKFDEVESCLRRMQKLLHEISQLPGGEQLRGCLRPTGSEDKTINKMEEVNAIKRHLNGTRPYSICPHCQGKKATGCRGCNGTGWVSKMTWNSIEDKIKEKLK